MILQLESGSMAISESDRMPNTLDYYQFEYDIFRECNDIEHFLYCSDGILTESVKDAIIGKFEKVIQFIQKIAGIIKDFFVRFYNSFNKTTKEINKKIQDALDDDKIHWKDKPDSTVNFLYIKKTLDIDMTEMELELTKLANMAITTDIDDNTPLKDSDVDIAKKKIRDWDVFAFIKVDGNHDIAKSDPVRVFKDRYGCIEEKKLTYTKKSFTDITAIKEQNEKYLEEVRKLQNDVAKSMSTIEAWYKRKMNELRRRQVREDDFLISPRRATLINEGLAMTTKTVSNMSAFFSKYLKALEDTHESTLNAINRVYDACTTSGENED